MLGPKKNQDGFLSVLLIVGTALVITPFAFFVSTDINNPYVARPTEIVPTKYATYSENTNEYPEIDASSSAQSIYGTGDISIAEAYILPSPTLTIYPTIKLPSPTPSSKKTTIPTNTPTSSPKPKPSATTTPIKTPTTAPSPTPTQPPASLSTTDLPAGTLDGDKVFLLVNNYRTGKGMKEFVRDQNLCKLAQERAPELYDEIFVTGNMHAGLKARNLPYWITENIASYNTEEAIVSWWLSDYIHKKAIESTNVYSCAACYKKSCSQLFTSYVAR